MSTKGFDNDLLVPLDDEETPSDRAKRLGIPLIMPFPIDMDSPKAVCQKCGNDIYNIEKHHCIIRMCPVKITPKS